MSTDVLGTYNFSEIPLVNGVPMSAGGSPIVLTFYTGTVSAASGTSIIPADNTVPLSTEGTQIWTQTVTPASVTSRFVINYSGMFDSSSSTRYITFALFRSTTCIRAISGTIITAARPAMAQVSVVDVPGVTTPTTYSMRVGTSSAATWYINQNTGTMTYGGTVNRGPWTIMEIA